MKKFFYISLCISCIRAWGAVCEMPDSSFLDLSDFTGTNAFYEHGIYGQNVNVANIELNVPDTDSEMYMLFLKDTSYSTYYPSEYTSERIGVHQNQTLSVMAGYNASYPDQNVSTGLAHKANFTAVQAGENTIFSSADKIIISTYEKFFSNGIEVISSSWKDSGERGHLAGAVLDSLARKNPSTIFVAAASNDGDEGAGYVNSPYKNMNVISVAALDDATYFKTVAPTSSYGPNDFYNPISGGIVKGVVSAVDIAAPGTVYTVKANETLGNERGTSLAAPIVSSAATLMVSYSKSRGMDAESRDARLIKSILLNSASKPESWDNGGGYVDSVSANGKVYNGVFSTSQSLDLHSGAGILNAKQALAEYDNFGKTSFLGEVAKSESAFYYFDAAGENNVLNATLCWFVGSSVDGVEYDGDGNISSIDADASHFANLDLRLWAAGTDGEYELIAQSVSDYNNVEHLFLNLDKSGSYALEVYFADMAYGDTESETFALAWNLAQVPEPAQSAFAASILAGALLAVSKLRGMLKNRGKSAN